MADKVLPGPCSERQKMYMETETDVTLYGGAAGSGKSEISVIDFLQYTDIPNFIGVITRRTTPQLTGPGGILTKCKRVFSQAYDKSEYTWRAKDGKFVFHNSGAEIYLKHFENDQADVNWQGAEGNLFCVDEGTQFTQHMIQYIMSRMRNPSCPSVPPRLKITCNPDADHFLAAWVAPYLNPDGTPDRSKDGMIRYFSFLNGTFVWGETKEELCEKHDLSMDDVLSFKFISANVDDNPILREINPKYVAWLKGLRGVERERLLNGNWLIREESSGFFKREWVRELDFPPPKEEFTKIVRAWDLAGELKSDANPDPDYSAGVKMGRTKTGEYVILDVIRFRARFGELATKIVNIAKSDGAGVDILIPQDPNASAKAAARMLVQQIIEQGFYAKCRPTNKSKVDRFRPFAASAENGTVAVVKNCATCEESKVYNDNNVYYVELEKFTGSRNNHDDMVDATSDAFVELAQSLSIPEFFAGLKSMPLERSNPFSN